MENEIIQLTTHLARRVRSLRQARGWSLAGLSERAGLSKTIVAKIESGAGNPSLETLLRLADALEVTIGSFLTVDEDPGTRVLRFEEPAYVKSESGLMARSIWSDGRNRRVETHEMVLEGGVDYHSDPHPPGTEELVFCMYGALTVGPQGREVELGQRDAARYSADLPHRYYSAEGCGAVLLMSYPAAG